MNKLRALNKVINEAYGINEDENYGMPKEIFDLVDGCIKAYIDDHGDSFDLYADYNDELSDDSITEIFDSINPREAFSDLITDWDWDENADIEYKEIINNFELSDEIKEEYTLEIEDMVRDRISYSIPFDHYNKTIGLDLYIKCSTDDALIWAETENEDDEPKLESVGEPIKKLLEMQGYTVEEFVNFFNENESGSEFLESLKKECENTTYNDSTEVVFLGQAQLLDAADAIVDKLRITIPADAICGITDSGNGSGSILGVKLEKDIQGVVGEDFDLFYKNGYHYNVDEICGLVRSAWDAPIAIEKK